MDAQNLESRAREGMHTFGFVSLASPAACVASSMGPLFAIVRTWKAIGRKVQARGALDAKVRSMVADVSIMGRWEFDVSGSRVA